MTFDFFAKNWGLFDILFVALGLVIYVSASQTLHQRRHPSAAIAWVMGILLLPYLTLPLYLAFGSRKVIAHRKRPSRIANLPTTDATPSLSLRTQQLAHAMGLPPPAIYDDLALHADGQEALHALQEIIASALVTLDVSTFLIGRDSVGKAIMQQLAERALAGVHVRLLIDGVGIYMGGYPDFAPLKAAGVEVLRFIPPFSSPIRGRTNLRNHRKMVLADGTRLWCGGRNLAAEYFVGDHSALINKEAWLDLSFNVKGEIAAHAAHQFAMDWAFAAAKTLPILPESPVTHCAISPQAQLIDSGPDRPDDTIYTLLLLACFTAQRRILAVSPYFVPEMALLTALTLAARRGIAVDLVLPLRSNHRMADFARHRALREIAEAGGRVWLHPQMIHAKAIVIDDDLAFAGSANLDGRSLFLNYEMMIAFYDRPAIEAFAHWIDKHRAECTRYIAKRPGLARSLAEGLLLWLAFQL